MKKFQETLWDVWDLYAGMPRTKIAGHLFLFLKSIISVFD